MAAAVWATATGVYYRVAAGMVVGRDGGGRRRWALDAFHLHPLRHRRTTEVIDGRRPVELVSQARPISTRSPLEPASPRDGSGARAPADAANALTAFPRPAAAPIACRSPTIPSRAHATSPRVP